MIIDWTSGNLNESVRKANCLLCGKEIPKQRNRISCHEEGYQHNGEKHFHLKCYSNAIGEILDRMNDLKTKIENMKEDLELEQRDIMVSNLGIEGN